MPCGLILEGFVGFIPAQRLDAGGAPLLNNDAIWHSELLAIEPLDENSPAQSLRESVQNLDRSNGG